MGQRSATWWIALGLVSVCVIVATFQLWQSKEPAAKDDAPPPKIAEQKSVAEPTTVAPKIEKPKGLYGGDFVSGLGGELTSLAFDRDDMLWIASRYDGIFAYHGCRFTRFDQYNASLPDIGISQVIVGRDNKKWFTSRRGCLYSFDNKTWQVYRPERDFPIVAFCGAADGSLWLAREYGAIQRLRDGQITTIVRRNSSDDPSGLPGIDNSLKEVRDIFWGGLGRIWIAGDKRLLRFDGQTWTELEVDAALLPISKFFPGDRDDEVVLASPGGLYAYRNGESRQLAKRPFESDPTGIWRSTDGRFIFGSRTGFMTLDGEAGRRLSDHRAPLGLGVVDAAFDAQRRIWIATHVGLHYLDGGTWISLSPPHSTEVKNLTSTAWRDLSTLDIIRQEPSAADIHEVLENPARFANQKLRFIGNMQTGFEYANLVDAEGNALGMWPEFHSGWSNFIRNTGIDKEFDVWGRGGNEDLGSSRWSQHMIGWPPEPAKPTKTIEYIGYLDWGGYYGHLSAWSRQFTITECYPTDLDPAKRQAIHRSYLKFFDPSER